MTSREVLGKMTVASPLFAWPMVACVAGAVVLAMVGAPHSPSSLFLVGPGGPDDSPVVFALSAAIGMGVALAFDRHWQWLLTGGVVGVVIATALYAPEYTGITARVAGTEPTVHSIPVPVGALVSAAAGVLVIALFAAARQAAPMLGGIVAIAGYFGVALIGPLRAVAATPRVIVVGVAAAVAVVAAFLGKVEQANGAKLPGILAAAATVLPSVLVAITGEAGFGTVAGGVVGLVVLAVAIAASASVKAVVPVLATGLVLAAPVVLLVVLHDAPATGGIGWPIALAGAIVGAVAARWSRVAAALVALAALPLAWLATGAVSTARDTAEIAIWLFLFLVIAAVAATVGLAFSVVRTPAFGALAIASAVGVFGSINLWRAAVQDGSGLSATVGLESHWVSVGLLAIAIPLVLITGRAKITNNGQEFGRSPSRP